MGRFIAFIIGVVMLLPYLCVVFISVMVSMERGPGLKSPTFDHPYLMVGFLAFGWFIFSFLRYAFSGRLSSQSQRFANLFMGICLCIFSSYGAVGSDYNSVNLLTKTTRFSGNAELIPNFLFFLVFFIPGITMIVNFIKPMRSHNDIIGISFILIGIFGFVFSYKGGFNIFMYMLFGGVGIAFLAGNSAGTNKNSRMDEAEKQE